MVGIRLSFYFQVLSKFPGGYIFRLLNNIFCPMTENGLSNGSPFLVKTSHQNDVNCLVSRWHIHNFHLGWGKTLIQIGYTGWLIGILRMVYEIIPPSLGYVFHPQDMPTTNRCFEHGSNTPLNIFMLPKQSSNSKGNSSSSFLHLGVQKMLICSILSGSWGGQSLQKNPTILGFHKWTVLTQPQA